MKSLIQTAPLTFLVTTALFAGGSHMATAEKTNLLVSAKTLTPSAAAPAKPAPVTAADIAAAPVPQSVFEVPRKVTEGKDPFFPNSTRVYGVDPSAKGKASPSLSVDLLLKGISGTPEQPLAIVNTTTFATGEIAEVIHRNGRLKVQCLEINMAKGTVLLQIGADRRELRLGATE